MASLGRAALLALCLVWAAPALGQERLRLVESDIKADMSFASGPIPSGVNHSILPPVTSTMGAAPS